MKITIIFPARDFEIGKATMPVMPVAPTFFTQTSLKKSFREQLVLPTMDSVFNIYLSRTKDLRDIMDQHGQSVFYNEIKD